MRGSRVASLLFQVIGFSIGWFACIMLAAQDRGIEAAFTVVSVVLIQYVFQRVFVKQTLGLGRLIFIFVFVGSLIDTAFLKLGLIEFVSNPWTHTFVPPWMIGIWLGFAMVFYATLQCLFERYILLGLLAFFLFPLAYGLASRLGAMTFPHGDISSMVIGLVWAILLPCCMMLFNTSMKRDRHVL